MNAERYQVVPYSRANLVAFFSAKSFKSRKGYINSKPQISYLDDFCTSQRIQTLVLENEYIDRHFSEDFSGYYVRCFDGYRKTCARIHFFKKKFSEPFLTALLTQSGRSSLLLEAKLGYCGFVVVKPLPETVVGRTCVIPPSERGEFPALRNQPVNLFGIDLNVRSLPFQEQDHEVAACATSALWSVLHGTAKIFDHPVLSPLEITQSAQSKHQNFGRALPNDGLDMYQMAGVVRDIGLEAEIIDVSQQALLQAHAYAYLRGSVPVLLGINFNIDRPEENPELHAIALVGYELKTTMGPPVTEGDFRTISSRITRLFAHDDGVGPFSSLDLEEHKPDLVKTSWSDNGDRISAQPDQMLVPLYSQIRTPFLEIFEGIIQFDEMVEHGRIVSKGISLPGRLEWDIHLIALADLKREIRSDKSLATNTKRKILTASLPRFLWRAVGIGRQKAFFDFLFDATDLRQGHQLVSSISHDRVFDRSVEKEFKEKIYFQSDLGKIASVILDHYRGGAARN